MDGTYDSRLIHEWVDAEVAALAERQHGVFDRRQVEALGLSAGKIRHRLAARRWEQADRNVFRLAGTTPSFRQSLMVAVLAWGEGAVVSHRSAARLYALPGFQDAGIEVTVPRNRRRSHGPGVVHRAALAPADTLVFDTIPVTTTARTLLDLAASTTLETVEEALDDALRRNLVSVARMRWAVRSHSHRPGVTAMRGLLDAREGIAVPESVFETRLLRLIRTHGLPRPVTQHVVRDPASRFVARLDFAYPSAKVGIEADGRRYHDGRRQFAQDRERLNRLMLLGWRILHVTWDQVNHDPERVARRIEAALR